MGEERRRHPRYETSFTVVIESKQPLTEPFRDIATLHDISNSGLSFISEKPGNYEIGQQLTATIQPPEDATDSGITMYARARIVWMKPLSEMAETVQVGVNLDAWIDAKALAG